VNAGTGESSVAYQEVDSEDAGQRLDNFLLSRLKGVPRSHVYQLIRSGQVRVNKGRSNARYRVQAGDSVRIPPVRSRGTAVPIKELGGLGWLERQIVHENERFMVIDKPSGLAVHGGTGLDLGCIEAIRSLRPGLKTLELAHRLDRMTSGCLLIAKRRSALRILHTMFREGHIEKRYLALVAGNWQHGSITVDVPLAVDRSRIRGKVEVSADGKSALSEFKLIEHYGSTASLVEVRIATGRTHQIRVHAAHVGHPIAGDERYGNGALNEALVPHGLKRLFLHSHTVAFDWPETDESFVFSTPLPDELKRVLDRLV
jgi:23S rRNA pseudouridine955/2504/2580 synthase